MLFLSYAEEDGESASQIAEWFQGWNIEVFRWEDPEVRGGRFIKQIEQAMSGADGYVALMSPDFVRSAMCHREAELAILREEDLQSVAPGMRFISVLKVRDTPFLEAGFLGAYDWLDATAEDGREQALRGIADRLAHGKRVKAVSFPGAGQAVPAPVFRNRVDELERVLRGLTNVAGPHFWLVIAPPKLGKTWFVDHLAAKLLEEPAAWSTRRVDLRDYPPDRRRDPSLLLMHMFGLPEPASASPDGFRTIAGGILRGRRPFLCLLDSAELLDQETAIALRSAFGQIYQYVQDGGKSGVRLGLVVASRRDDEWRTVIPSPRPVPSMSPLPLTEFRRDVVQDALLDLARQMERTFSPAELRQDAALVYRLSEGLPALLVLCLRWIRKEEWLGLERLAGQEVFEELAGRYIKSHLLCQDSLLPGRREQDDEPRRALEVTFRLLAPYRLLTQSHLRHHLESDHTRDRVLGEVGWSFEDLWKAISDTALMSRPLDEPWQAMQGAIRRLLYRYFYPSDSRRAEVHRQARTYAGFLWRGQNGNDQVIGLVECLWHEAAALRFGSLADMDAALRESASTLAGQLRPSALYTTDELRRAAARRMRSDEEFGETVSNVDGLLARLVSIVESDGGDVA